MSEVTIKDVAKKANVSITTVSRVINGNYPVSVENRHQVEKAMQELNYRPNVIARNLRRNQTNLIALVVADISNRFFMEAAKGLEQEIEAENYNLILASSNGKIAKEHQLIDSLIGQRIGGLVIASSDKNGDRINTCLDMKIPVVLIDRIIDGVDTNQVGWDNSTGAYQLTSLLIEKGHRHIAIVNVSLTHQNGLQRKEGFLKALSDNDIPVIKKHISPANFSKEEARTWAAGILNRKKAPTALFCANNIMLEGVLAAVEDLGMTVGRDISLVSFGTVECNHLLRPKITCLYQDSFAMGKQAGAILKKQLAFKEGLVNTKIVLSTKLMQGESICQL